MRVTSEIFVRALLRRANAGGAHATIVNRGADSAGAIFVVLNSLEGVFSLIGPAPAGLALDEAAYEDGDRRFIWFAENVAEREVEERLKSEKSFDPDIWIIEIEDRESRHFLESVRAGS